MSVEPARHLFTVDEYERMAEAGLFEPDQRLELLAGEIVEMTPIGPPHVYGVAQLDQWFHRAVGDRALVIAQSSLRVNDLTEPEPDLTLVRPLGAVYRSRLPRADDVLLLIEVSDSTVGWDRRVKRPLYAAAGIAEMWIVDLGGRMVEVATEPGPSGYAKVVPVLPGEIAVPGAFPDLQFPVAELFD